MADLAVTAANVLQGAGALVDDGISGDTITAGQYLYKAADGRWARADADGASDLIRAATAVALNGASANQPIKVQRGGEVNPGCTLTPGTTYYLSNTPGGICAVADVGTGEYYCILGIAKSASNLKLSFAYSGVSA